MVPRHGTEERNGAGISTRRNQGTGAGGMAGRLQRDVAVLHERLLALLEDADPLSRLTEADLVRANARREFVREDIQTLSPENLARRVRTVLATDDLVAQVLHQRALEQRLRQLDMQESLSVAEQTDRHPLHQFMEQLRAKTADPTAGDKKHAATAQLDLARQLTKRVGEAQAKAHRTLESLAAQMRASAVYSGF